MTVKIILILCVIVSTGMLGGIANYLLSNSRPQSDDPAGGTPALQLSWLGYAFLGIIAALIVPLFLSLAQSSLLDDIIKATCNDEPTNGAAQSANCSSLYGKLFIFAGFCLLAAFSSRAFLQGMSEKLLNDMKRSVENAQRSIQRTNEKLDEVSENIDSPPRPTPDVLMAEVKSIFDTDTSLEAPSADDRKILKALAASSFTWRTLAGTATDSGLPQPLVHDRLNRMVELTMAETRIGRKSGRPLYAITSRGLAALQRL
ncbi:MAG: YEATS-associated helix-containing protein [Ferrovibrio sp.]|uniref:YEATS-associated helix-containing protein n=1 Tax=Ferrovibrio sp. TaxID=1917215 RepID=UPI00391B7B81